MSNGSSVGPRFKGTAKGTVTYAGKNIVDSDKNVEVGGLFDGIVEEQANVNFNEINQLNARTQQNTDQKEAESSEAAPSKVEGFKLEESESKELGFRINGHMTIFNQEFKDSIYYRSGSANDVESLTTTFRKFGIEPSIKLDFRRKDIVNEIKALSTTDFSTCKLFLCVYMSHGHENGYVSAADKEFNLRKTIIDPIMENSSLNGIPKIFITVACRGANNYEEHDNEQFDGCITSTANGIDYSNCIISYSTYEGHVSKRTLKGTYFIQSLCDKINNDDGNTKIHSLFAKVNGELAEMGKQVPVFETTMRDICFRDLASTH